MAAFSIRECVCRENRRSKPRSTVMLATTAMRIAGAAAITENSVTIRMCSRDPARPCRRAWNTRQSSHAMTAIRKKTVQALIHSSARTTPSVGRIGVRLASTRKVTTADRRASPTATSPTVRANHPAGGAAEGISAVVAWLTSTMKGFRGCGAFDTCQPAAAMYMSRVRLFYNNVAELRQILGVIGFAPIVIRAIHRT